MPDKTKQVSTTSQGESNSSFQNTGTTKNGSSTRQAVIDETSSSSTETSPEKKSVTTVTPGGKTSTTQTEDFSFQIQFVIPVRGGLGSDSSSG
jgi:hypothetical protein